MAKKILRDIQFLRAFARTKPREIATVAKFKVGDRVVTTDSLHLTGTIHNIRQFTSAPNEPMYEIILDKSYPLPMGTITTRIRREEDGIKHL